MTEIYNDIDLRQIQDATAKREAMRAIRVRNAMIARNERYLKKRNAWAGEVTNEGEFSEGDGRFDEENNFNEDCGGVYGCSDDEEERNLNLSIDVIIDNE